MKISLIFLIATFAVACGQKADDTFLKPMYFPYGIYIGADPVLHLTWPTGSESVIWDNVLFKPLLFPPIAHSHDYNIDLKNKPGMIELAEALKQLGYLPVPGKTTAAINAIVVPAGEGGIVKDVTLDCYKIWSNGAWRIIPTTN